jgi:hypothetical protein
MKSRCDINESSGGVHAGSVRCPEPESRETEMQNYSFTALAKVRFGRMPKGDAER